ncbi:FAR1 DNA-binding domain [Sesbania bispinosa]|nr:FAR1 DNA-binding domain [Sesbania bispinosa]
MDTNPFNFSHMDMQVDFIPDNIPVTHFDSLDDMPQSTVVDEPHVEPYVGMEFNSLEEVVGFYNSFAKAKWFGIRTRSSKKNYCISVCVREGERPVKSDKNEKDNGIMRGVKRKCSTMSMRCQASITVSKDEKRDKWVIKSFDNNHNHVMASPKSVSYLRCHKKMSIAAKKLVEKFSEEGLPTGKVASMFDGSGLAFSNRDC